MEEIIKQLFEDKYRDSYDTLKEVAKDDSNLQDIKYPTEITDIKMLNWDSRLKKKLALCQDICGVDTIDVQNGKINLIEFKNGKIKPQNLRLKAAETILTLFKLLKKESKINNIGEVFNLKMNYLVVLNPEEGNNYKQLGVKTLNSISRDRLIKSKVIPAVSNDYLGTYFEEIHVLSFDQFEERYLNKYHRKIN